MVIGVNLLITANVVNFVSVSGAHANGSCGIDNGGCKDICLSTPQGPRCGCWIGAEFNIGPNCSATSRFSLFKYLVSSSGSNGVYYVIVSDVLNVIYRFVILCLRR